MEVSLLTRIVLPVAIVVIMFGLGLTLAVQDFARIARYPRAVAHGLEMVVARTAAHECVSTLMAIRWS